MSTARMWNLFYIQITLFSLQALAVWPAPNSLKSGSTVLWIEPNVKVTYNGGSVCRNSLSCLSDVLLTEHSFVQSPLYAAGGGGSFSSNIIVHDAIDRALTSLFTQSLVPWKLIPRDGLSSFEPASDSKMYIDSLTITQTGIDSNFAPLAGEVDESYNITISKNGEAEIVAVSSNGCLHALQTFIQLFYRHSAGIGIYTNLAPVTIIDAPKFQHRALNMDVSRNWYPVCTFLFSSCLRK